MNKRLHRVVFNAARGLRVVVQETARAAGKATGATALVSATVLISAWPASAQIAGAPGAPPNLRPTVLVAPNGVPLVNIQTPSAAGVSRNLYHQFDVSSRGVILNNSRTDAQTQLGGWVQGNPYLATGAARIILNEITSGKAPCLGSAWATASMPTTSIAPIRPRSRKSISNTLPRATSIASAGQSASIMSPAGKVLRG